MTAYELRFWPIPFGDRRQPLQVVAFEADTEVEAEARMYAAARALRRDRQVFLHVEGRPRSIAAEDGLADIPEVSR